jgi:hypothetical protein
MSGTAGLPSKRSWLNWSNSEFAARSLDEVSPRMAADKFNYPTTDERQQYRVQASPELLQHANYVVRLDLFILIKIAWKDLDFEQSPEHPRSIFCKARDLHQTISDWFDHQLTRWSEHHFAANFRLEHHILTEILTFSRRVIANLEPHVTRNLDEHQDAIEYHQVLYEFVGDTLHKLGGRFERKTIQSRDTL